MIKRLISFLIGIILIIFVVYLGIKTTRDQNLVIWFGLASAILVPLGFATIGYAFSSGNRKILERLSKIPEIETLIDEAKTQEDKIRLLEQERSRLYQVVQLEARKQALLSNKDSLQEDAKRILHELKEIDKKLVSLNVTIQETPLSNDVRQLQERIRLEGKGVLIFRIFGIEFSLDRDLLLKLPGGSVLFSYASAFHDGIQLIRQLRNLKIFTRI